VKPVDSPLRDCLRDRAASRAAISPSIDLGKKIYFVNEFDMIDSFLRKSTHNKCEGRGNNQSDPCIHYQKV